MRRFNSDVSDKPNLKTPYLNIFVVTIIQFFMSILIVTYGVFLMQFVIKGVHNVKSSLWTAVLFNATFKITNPWVKTYCKHIVFIKQKVHKRNIVLAGVILSSGLVLVSFFSSLANLVILYGIFGGVFTSVISCHLHSATSESFKDYPQLFGFLEQLVKAICLLVTPHLVLFFTNLYTTSQTFLIVAAFILNIIPFSLLIRTRKAQKLRLCKFQTLDKLSVEMTDLHITPDVTLSSSSSSSDEDNEDEEEKLEPHVEIEENKLPSNTQKYYENVGVKILPNIPEESDAEEDDDINEISSKRLSRISAILLEMSDNNRRNSNLSAINYFQPEETPETVETEAEEILPQRIQKKSRCFSITSSTIFQLKLKRRRLKSFCYRNLTRCCKSLRTPQFYPAVISSSCTSFLSTIVFATTPYLMFMNEETKNRTHPITPEESTFLLTIMGFTWLFFLAGHPVVNKLSHLKMKILFLAGISILGLSLFIVHRSRYDNFVFFSLTFGFGHGIVSYAENIANEDFFGKVNWKLLHGALEISTGFIVILIYFFIYFLSIDMSVLLSHAFWVYVFNVVLWTVVYILKKIVIFVKNTGRYKLDRFPDLDLVL